MNLQWLSLDRNLLESLPAGIFTTLSSNVEFSKLVNLESLFLGDNKFYNFPEPTLALVKLKKLSLGYNQISSIPSQVSKLINLESLFLENNTLTSVPKGKAIVFHNFPEISRLSKLEVLNLHDNKLQVAPAEISSLTSLQELYLGKNKLVAVPEQYGSLTRLQRFALDDNALTDIPGSELEPSGLIFLVEFSQLTKLEFLSLENNRLETIPIQLSSLVNLKIDKQPYLLSKNVIE